MEQKKIRTEEEQNKINKAILNVIAKNYEDLKALAKR
jgi:hypothetical protein